MIAVLELSILQCDVCDVTFSDEKGNEYFYDESNLIKQALSKDWIFVEDCDAESVNHYCPKCSPAEYEEESETPEVTDIQKPLIVEIEKDLLVELYNFAYEQAKITGMVDVLHDIDRKIHN